MESALIGVNDMFSYSEQGRDVPSSVEGLEPRRVCAYQRYDRDTLDPENEETEIRVAELAHVLDAVRGRRVLDLGCNGGLSSLLAARAGAASVDGIDVDTELVRRLNETAERMDLPVHAEAIPFWDCPIDRRADVVFAFEIVHWLVDQGSELPAIARRLRALTGQVMFIETPWDTSEPSIAAAGSMDENRYSARDLIECLLAEGFNVRIMHFSRYFLGASKRVMIEARPVAQ